MEIETESEDKRLNKLVAVTVVLAVFMAVSKVKDDNINQAMQKVKSESVDAGGISVGLGSSCMSTRTGLHPAPTWRRSASIR